MEKNTADYLTTMSSLAQQYVDNIKSSDPTLRVADRIKSLMIKHTIDHFMGSAVVTELFSVIESNWGKPI